MSARILVADDSVTIQKVVELTFSKEDFALTQARNGEEAIRKAKEIRPDLVLLDLVMPDMSGYEVCAALRAEPALRNVPIILLAGTFEPFDQKRGMQAGADDFVTKPFESQVLIGKVKQRLFAKVMEAGTLANAGRPTPDAVTVKIPSAPVTSTAAPVSLMVTPPAAESLSPPPLAPPQVELWQLPGSVPAPSSQEPADVSREEPSISPAASAEPEGLPLDLSALDLESLSVANESAADAADVLPLPESLSLDDLLAAGSELPTEVSLPGASEGGASTLEPIFELSDMQAPPLPMVEVGHGEPFALSEQDLLRPAASEPIPPDTLTLEVPELDLTALAEVAKPAEGEVAPAQPIALEAVDVFSEFPLPAPVAASLETDGAEAAGATSTPEVPASLPAIAELPNGAEVQPSAAAGDTAELGAVPIPAVSGPAPLPEEVVAPSPGEVTPPEMAAMREAVTERVAHDLRRELSEKLLDRFEKIVWEVVPDLAEILITKEIERIRRLAEEDKLS